MPCFSEPIGGWATTDSSHYQGALADVARAKHMIDCYLNMNGISTPDGSPATLPGKKVDLKLVPFSMSLVTDELIYTLGQHCMCDGIDFYRVYEMRSVIGDHGHEPIYRFILFRVQQALRSGLYFERFDPLHFRSLNVGDEQSLFVTRDPELAPAVLKWSGSSCLDLPRRWLTLDPPVLDRLALTAGHSYPLLDRLLGDKTLDGLRWSHILYSFMAYLSMKPDCESKYAPAIARLSELITTRTPVGERLGGFSFTPKLGEVDLSKKLWTFSRGQELVAACSGGKEGPVFQCFRPLCLQAAQWLKQFSFGPVDYPSQKWKGAKPSFVLPSAAVWTQLAVAKMHE